MSNLVLNVDISAGTSIGAAADEMQALADRLDLTVRARFNDVTCLAVPGGLAAVLAARQQAMQSAVRPFKIAASR